MLLHMSSLWENWSNLTEIVKKGADPERKPPKPMDTDIAGGLL